MSDENTPKLRLRPKLAGAPPAVTPAPATPPVENPPPEASSALPAPVVPEVKPVVLRSKLALKVEEPAKIDQPASASSAPPTPPALEPGPYIHDPRAFPAPAAKSLQVTPRAKPTLGPAGSESSPADSGAVPPFPLPANKEKLPAVLHAPPPQRPGSTPAAQETWPAVLNAPPPPGLAPTIKAGSTDEEPAEITAIRKASTYPFPAPTAKFPPLPGIATAADTAPQEATEQESFLKKLLLIGTLVVVLLGAGAYFGFKFFIKPAVKASTPPAAVTNHPLAAPEPKTPPPVAPTPIPESVPAPVTPAAVAPAATVPVEPVAIATEAPSSAPAAVAPPAVVPVAPPQVKAPPPEPSLAFKAWVINLRIRGVRGGDAQRVFIDKTSYVPGEVVNQKLGIVFAGYDEDTRMLTFRDQTGAIFERRH